MSKDLYLLAFYVPKEHLDRVLNKIFNAGAGKFKKYDRCAWTSEGMGQFRPLENATPFIGEIAKDTYVTEVKVECIVEKENMEQVRETLLNVHPYEEVAYHFIAIL